MENKENLAMELLTDLKKQNKRQFIVILVILTMWFATIGYLVYILNDIGTIEDYSYEIDQDSENGNNNFIGNDGEIING